MHLILLVSIIHDYKLPNKLDTISMTTTTTSVIKSNLYASGALHSGTRLGENVGGNADTYIYLWQSMSFFRIIFEINNVKYVGYN